MAGRDRQRQRTRKDLLQAAAKLMADGRTPTLEEIAEAAMISRATAYRYFPGLDALLIEAALDVAMPEPDALAGGPSALADRLVRVDDAVDAVVSANEAPLRAMIVHAIQRRLRGEDALPVRQNRRMPLIEAAIAGADGRISREAGKRLAQAMALIVGTEAMLVTKDVLQISDDEAREVRRWAIRALAAAALSHP